MAIVYLTRTADEIAADRRDDMERDAWGEQRYTEYRIEREYALQQWRREMAVKLSPNYAETGELSDTAKRYLRLHERHDTTTHAERMAYYNRRLAEGAALLARCTPYVRYEPPAEIPF